MDESSGESNGILSFLGRPAGDPSQLHRGARAWERLADELDESFRALQRAVEGGVGDGAWEGQASRNFLGAWEPLQVAGRDGQHHIRDFAGQLSHLAAKIGEAQDQWERAIAAAAVVTGVSVGLTFFTFGASNALAAGAAARSAATIAAIAAWLDSILAGAGALFATFATTAVSLAARFTVNFSVNLVAQGAAGAIQRPDHSPFHLDLSDAAAYAGLDTVVGPLGSRLLPRGIPIWAIEATTGVASDMAAQMSGPDDLDWLQVGLSGGLGAGGGALGQRVARRFHMANGSLMESTALPSGAGSDDPELLRRLLDRIPPVSSTADPSDPKLRRFAAAALGRVPEELRFTGLEAGGLKGASGASVSLIRDRNGRAIGALKVFPNNQTSVFARELSAMERLGKERFAGSVKALAVGRALTPEGEKGVLVMSVAPGHSMDEIIARPSKAPDPERTGALAELEGAVVVTARTLADLHTRPHGSGAPLPHDFLKQLPGNKSIVKRLKRASGPLLREADLHPQLIRQRMDELLLAFRDNPGGAGLTHGDAHPGNFFYDPGVGITLIDTPNLHFSMDANRKPAGTPARDVAKFYQSLASFGPRAGLLPEKGEIARLHQIFLGSYRDAGGIFTEEAFAYFRAEAALGDLRRAATAVRLELRTRPSGDKLPSSHPDVKAFDRAVELAREALGLGR